MCWLKRDLWKAGIASVSTLLLLVLMVWLPISAATAHERALGSATPATVTVQATPTEDATVTALNKEKLAQEVQQLKEQNAPDLLGWLRANASILLSTLVVVIGGLIGLWRWLGDRRSEREKRAEEQKRWLEDRQAERERRDQEQQRWLKDQEAEREKRTEERFQAVVEGLGSEREEAKIGAAITLRTFLHPGYEQFYRQVFDLAVAYLRLPRTSLPSEDQTTPLPLTTLSQELIVVFKEAFPLARRQKRVQNLNVETLDASRVQLDHAYLVNADLYQAWLVRAFLRKATFGWANFQGANLFLANLQESYSPQVNFSGAYLRAANLSRAKWIKSNLSQANLSLANLSGANLSNANFNKANLSEADLSDTNLTKTNLEEALSLKDANLRGAKGLTKEQLAACKAKGAIVDEDLTANSTQSTVASPPPEPRNDEQASSTPSAQGSVSTPDPGGNSVTSSQQGSES